MSAEVLNGTQMSETAKLVDLPMSQLMAYWLNTPKFWSYADVSIVTKCLFILILDDAK